MGFSSLASRVNISNQSSSRQGRSIDRFIVHHAASTSIDVVVGMMVSGSREVSANYVVGDTVVGVVPEEVRAWTSASADWDGRAVTVETINDSTNGWTVSDRTFDNLARLIADVAKRYDFPITDDTVLTHQELYTRYGASYATSCPGDLQRRKGELLALANTYLAGATAPAPTVWEDDMLIYQIVDWDNRCYLITAAGHAYVGSPGAVGAWSKATGKPVAPVNFGDFFELAKSVNDAAAAGVLASKGDVKNVSSDVIAEAQKRGLIPA